MKRIFLMLALAVSAFAANAQENMNEAAEVVKTMPSTGDYYEGFTRPLTFNRMIPPYHWR